MWREIRAKDIAECEEKLRLVDTVPLPAPIRRVFVSSGGMTEKDGVAHGIFRYGGIILTLSRPNQSFHPRMRFSIQRIELTESLIVGKFEDGNFDFNFDIFFLHPV